MPLVTAITTCKGRLEHLKQTLPALMAAPGLEVVVVDYDCPDHAGDWVRGAWPQAKVVSVSDRPWYNRSDANNRGAAAASGDWLFFADADVRIADGFMQSVQDLLRPGCFLLADPRPAELWGALFVSRRDFEAIGGFDEAMKGYGSEDVDLLARLMMAGVQEARFPSRGFGMIQHDQAMRTRFHQLDDIALSGSINGFYRTAKNDLARQGVVLDLAGRHKLYADVASAFAAPGGIKTFQIGFRSTLVPGLTVNAALRYDLTPTDTSKGD
jgi:glycosyltransferase involved in cell wall biosynthesis